MEESRGHGRLGDRRGTEGGGSRGGVKDGEQRAVKKIADCFVSPRTAGQKLRTLATPLRDRNISALVTPTQIVLSSFNFKSHCAETVNKQQADV
eukprot:493842-Hanusia_phi.AAC.1